VQDTIALALRADYPWIPAVPLRVRSGRRAAYQAAWSCVCANRNLDPSRLRRRLAADLSYAEWKEIRQATGPNSWRTTRQLKSAREQFDRHPAVTTLFHGDMEPVAMEAFLIASRFAALAWPNPSRVGSAAPAAGAGELGLTHLGRALEAHAPQAADHQPLMLADARHLVDRWNEVRGPELNIPALLAATQTPGEGPRLIARRRELLGESILDSLSFLREHVDLDVGHTGFNRLQLSWLLAEHPGSCRVSWLPIGRARRIRYVPGRLPETASGRSSTESCA
jgi:hypothetical protein